MTYSLIVSAKMNDIDRQAWLADGLSRIAENSAHWIVELLPWNWKRPEAMDCDATRLWLCASQPPDVRGARRVLTYQRRDVPRCTVTSAAKLAHISTLPGIRSGSS